MTDVVWPRVAWRTRFGLWLVLPPLLLLCSLPFTMTGLIPHRPVAVVCGLLIAYSAEKWKLVGWRRLGLVIDSAGITIGGDPGLRPGSSPTTPP